MHPSCRDWPCRLCGAQFCCLLPRRCCCCCCWCRPLLLWCASMQSVVSWDPVVCMHPALRLRAVLLHQLLSKHAIVCPPQFMGLCQLPPAIVTEYYARGSLYSCLRAARTDASAAAELTWARRLSMVSWCAPRRQIGCCDVVIVAAVERASIAVLCKRPPCGCGTVDVWNDAAPCLPLLQATDAATGLLYLHMRDILHRDGAQLLLFVDAAASAAAAVAAAVALFPACLVNTLRAR